jgi:hypothetical protein
VTKAERVRGEAQVIKCLPSKEALSSNSGTTKKKKKVKKKKKGKERKKLGKDLKHYS